MAYPIAGLTFFPTISLWVRRVFGKHNLTKEKSFIMACNHASFADDLIIPQLVIRATNNYIHMYCNDRFFKNFFLRKFLEWGRCVPIRVDDKSKTAKKW